MISPETLRLHPFFGTLNEVQLSELAMIAEKTDLAARELIFKEGDPAVTLYFLLEGSVDLYYTLVSARGDLPEKGLAVGEINPGEPFGISALIEPHLFTSTAIASRPGAAIRFEAQALRALFEKDRRLGAALLHSAARAALERLDATRVQIAAAWA